MLDVFTYKLAGVRTVSIFLLRCEVKGKKESGEVFHEPRRLSFKAKMKGASFDGLPLFVFVRL
jgi:hypothetical protein